VKQILENLPTEDGSWYCPKMEKNSELRIIWMDVPWTTTHVTRELHVCLANDYHILIGRFSLSMKDFQVLKISLKQRSCQMFFCCCKCLWYGLHHHTGTQQEVKTRPWVPIRTLEILQVFLKTGPIWYFCLLNQLKAQRLYRILWWSRNQCNGLHLTIQHKCILCTHLPFFRLLSPIY
jgi:hypothetical protein